MINLKKIRIDYLIKLTLIIILILYSSNILCSTNKIIFKINDKAYTLFDLENRIKYLDFVGNNKELTEQSIINDFISANLFYEYYKQNLKNNVLEENKVYENIFNTNKNIGREYKYKLDKNNILFNLKIDLARKAILEIILNSNLSDLDNVKNDIDLLYKFTINYINFNSKNNSEIINIINNLEDKNIKEIKLILKNKNINFFEKKQEINKINNLEVRIKNNILAGKNYFIFENNSNISLVFIKKKFETYEGLVADIFSVTSIDEIRNKELNCNYLNEMKNQPNILNKKYKFTDLNNSLKNNLININDYYKFKNNNEYVYIVLCNIEFDKDILNNTNLNKIINVNVKKIEKKFIKEYSKIYNLIFIDA
tara:strand:+ start:388 stop:1491 length:1104 start_codon:yes stop_codon:yes gene_type:complete